MNNGKQSEQLLKVLGGHSASLDRTSKCRGLSEQPLYSGGHKAMQHETRNWNNFDKCEPEQQYNKNIFEIMHDDDGRTDGRTDDGRTPDHGHPISSPCEPSAQVS